MTKNKVIFCIIMGSFLLLFTLGVVYYDFFVPKIGPLGAGEHHWTTIVMYSCNFVLSIITILSGIFGGLKLKKRDSVSAVYGKERGAEQTKVRNK